VVEDWLEMDGLCVDELLLELEVDDGRCVDEVLLELVDVGRCVDELLLVLEDDVELATLDVEETTSVFLYTFTLLISQ